MTANPVTVMVPEVPPALTSRRTGLLLKVLRHALGCVLQQATSPQLGGEVVHVQPFRSRSVVMCAS